MPPFSLRYLALALPLVTPPASAQTGFPLEVTEISNSAGGMEGQIPSNSEFGKSLASPGDLDGDGIADLIVGAEDAGDSIDPASGAVFVLFLQANGSVRDFHRIDRTSGDLCRTLDGFDNFGADLEFLGDLNGDGLPEIAVAAVGTDLPFNAEGAVYVLSLRADGTVADCTLIGVGSGGFGGSLAQGDIFGTSLACLGDLDGDGIPELAVGAPSDAGGGTNRGAVWILFLNADGSVKSELKIGDGSGGFSGTLDDGDFFAGSSAACSDQNGNGLASLALGAPFDDDDGTDVGAVWILDLASDGSVIGQTKITPSQLEAQGQPQPPANFGIGLGAAPDMDGNGFSDVFVGAGSVSLARGSFDLLLLGAGAAVTDHTYVCPEDLPDPYVSMDGDLLGSSYAILGRPGPEGAWSIAMGTPQFTSGPNRDGAVWIVLLRDGDPHVAFSTTDPTTGPSPLVVAFQDDSIGTGITSWSWDFDNGYTSTQQNPTMTFGKPGSYDISLTVTGQDGTCTRVKEAFVVVESATAQAIERNGSGINLELLDSLSLPTLGSTWTARVDGTSINADGLVFLVGYELGLDSLFSSFGEVLVNPTSTQQLLDVAVFVNGLSDHAAPIPNDTNLIGCTVSVQALVNRTGQLTNAIDLVLGT